MNIEELQREGIRLMRNYNVAICSIVRDCNKNLHGNIVLIEKLRSYFKSSCIIIFENDSKDKTKQTLKDWSKNSSNVFIDCQNYGIKTIPDYVPNGSNKYYSFHRISKMVEYRNKYLQKLEEIEFCPDYVIICDLDVSEIFIEGIFHSFGLKDQWDVVCANGYSLSPQLRKRYHDTYALVEIGRENTAQTEESIKKNRIKWNAIINQSQELIPVYSAHGGLSIYRYDAIKNLRYNTTKNDDPRVEMRCEHYSFCNEIRKKGFERIFINRELKLKYQMIDFKLIKKFIRDIVNSK